MGLQGCGTHDGLVFVGQAVECFVVDVERQVQGAFPPAGVVIEGGHFVQAQLQIVVRANPLGRINRAFFQRLVNFTGRNVLRHHAQALQHLASKATGAEFQAFKVVQALDFLAEPAAHLGAGVTTGHDDEVVLGVELVQQLFAIAFEHPGRQLARVHAEGDRTTDGKHLVLAKEVIGGGVAHLHRAALHAIDHVEGGHQLTGLVHRNIKLATGHALDGAGKDIGRPINGVQRFGKARGNAPAQCRLGVYGGRCTGSQDAGDAGVFQN